ncbi:MAG: GDP-mannose 4,6-dehydratase [Candidatus Zixiibacteriota bacterium]|nr:MAG: GDP-mannose 4,6-dehydratase [candidate division Zixibacteria bacterium]
MLITGGAGFVGSFLSEELLKRGYSVCAIDNLSTGKLENIAHLRENPDFELVIGNIMNTDLMDDLVARSETVFHLAAAVGVRLIIERPVETIETNILGTEIIYKLVNKHKKKVIITSTSEIYGKNNEIPFKETADSVYGPTTKSRWSYACSKAIDEFLGFAYHHEKKLPLVIVRLFNTIGPRQTGTYGMVVPTFVQQALLRHPITVFGDGEQTRCFANVKDVTWAVAELAETPEALGQVFNIGTTEMISIGDLAALVKRLCNSESEIVNMAYDKAYETGFEDMQQRKPDISKIQKLIGYKPKINLEKTIEEIIEYFKQ